MKEGIVYVLSNPAMPGMVKIGKTGRQVEARLSDLYSTGGPLPFECEYAAKVADMDKVEKAFHQAFGPNRVNPKREFFSIQPEQAIALLELMAAENLTPALKEEAEKVDLEAKASIASFKRKYRSPRVFTDYLPVGTELRFKNGDQVCKIADGRHVEFEGEITSLSPLTQDLLNSERAVWPAPYWIYEGKTLAQIFDEAEAQAEI